VFQFDKEKRRLELEKVDLKIDRKLQFRDFKNRSKILGGIASVQDQGDSIALATNSSTQFQAKVFFVLRTLLREKKGVEIRTVV